MSVALKLSAGWDRFFGIETPTAPSSKTNFFALFFPFWWLGYKGLWSVLWSRIIPLSAFVSFMSGMYEAVGARHGSTSHSWGFYGMLMVVCLELGRRADALHHKRVLRQPSALDGYAGGFASAAACLVCNAVAMILGMSLV